MYDIYFSSIFNRWHTTAYYHQMNELCIIIFLRRRAQVNNDLKNRIIIIINTISQNDSNVNDDKFQ